MKRRTFCASTLAGMTALALPLGRAFAGSAPSDVDAVSRLGKQTTLPANAVRELQGALRGSLLGRSSEGYDAARRIWNGAFDKHPALIARCVGAADVMQCVQFARAHDLLLAVRGGGHSLPGHSTCDGGLVIDLSRMRHVRIDPVKQIAHVEPGVLLGELDREAQAFGLITPAGTVSHTGVAGLTLGGGTGRLARRFGLSCDNLLGADIVTAAGQLLHASAQENADLFWGLRGGGGNFGVVTSFQFRLHALAHPVFGGDVDFPVSAAHQVFAFLREHASTASDELWFNPMLAREEGGELKFVVNVCYSGDPRRAERELASFRALRPQLRDALVHQPFVKLQSAEDDLSPHGRGYYMTGGFLQSLDADLLDACLERMRMPDARLGKIEFTHMGGAVSRVPVAATAYVRRGAGFNLALRSSWDDPSQAQARTEWGRGTWRAIEPHSQGFYANLSQDGEPRRVRNPYGEHLPRLVGLKTKYDPLNLFRLNPNIEPKGA